MPLSIEENQRTSGGLRIVADGFTNSGLITLSAVTTEGGAEYRISQVGNGDEVTQAIPSEYSLLSGEGWDGESDTPARQGDGSDIDDISGELPPIARWNAIQHEIIDTPRRVGVVAFAALGIDRVEIAANGGEVVSVETPTLNPNTGVVEYWVTLDPSDYPDGLVELRATIYSTHGECGTLQDTGGLSNETSLYLYCNAGETLTRPEVYISPSGNDETGNGTEGNPFATIAKAVGSPGTELEFAL